MKKFSHSEALFNTAQHYIIGGVNSPVRAFKSVGGHPLFIRSAKGASITDVDGNTYIDYVGSWGPMILGHAHPAVIEAITRTAALGTSFGAPCELEIILAELLCEAFSSIEKVRLLSSGTEATMTAIRLARGYTGRSKIIKFNGCYHGHADSLLVKAGSGAATLGIPSSAGVPVHQANDTLVAEFNDLASVATLFKTYPDEIAAIIVEPIAANMNLVLPQADFLIGLRTLCDQHQALLIFDEVITGFRVAFGGAQHLYAVTPDLTTLGKIIGGGLPVGALGGQSAIMEKLAPIGPVYQAGTLSGNPVAMAAGIATLLELKKPGFYAALQEKTTELASGLTTLAKQYQIPLQVPSHCGLFGLLFTEQTSVQNYPAVQACHALAYNRFFRDLLENGVYLAPSAFEVGFISAAHGNTEITTTLEIIEQAFKKLRFDFS